MLYIFHRTYIPGDAATNRVIAYAKHFAHSGIDVTLTFILRDRQFSKLDNVPEGVKVKYCWNKLLDIRPIKGIIRRALRFRLLQNIKDGDIVLVYGLTDFLPEIMKLQAKGVKVIHERTEHPDLFSYSGTLGKAVTAEEYYACCRNLDALLVISNPLKEFFISKGVSAEKIHIINMIVDFERFDVASANNSRKQYIFYCGSISNNAKDGVDRLMKAFALIAPKHPEVKLHLVGKIPEKEEERCNIRLAEELGIADRVIFKGFATAEQIPGLIENAKMAVLFRPDSIQAQYGFPTKLGEYLAAGVPVVVTAVGDITIFLKDKETAMIADPESIDNFAEKMLYLLDNPEQAAAIGKAGRQVALEHFNSATECSEILNVIALL